MAQKTRRPAPAFLRSIAQSPTAESNPERGRTVRSDRRPSGSRVFSGVHASACRNCVRDGSETGLAIRAPLRQSMDICRGSFIQHWQEEGDGDSDGYRFDSANESLVSRLRSSIFRNERYLIWFYLMGLVVNLDHGIIPAAVPDIEAKFGADQLMEAMLQVVSVVGILVGITIGSHIRLTMNKSNLLVSLVFLSCSLFGIWLMPERRIPQSGVSFGMGDGMGPYPLLAPINSISSMPTALPATDFNETRAAGPGGIPIEMHFSRFISGFASSYSIVIVPAWLDTKLPAELKEKATATYLSFGIGGTVIGYGLVLGIPVLRRLSDFIFSYLGKTLSDHTIHDIHSIVVFLLTGNDFRQAFFYAGALCVAVAVMVGIFVTPEALKVPSVRRSNQYSHKGTLSRLVSLRASPTGHSVAVIELSRLHSHRLHRSRRSNMIGAAMIPFVETAAFMHSADTDADSTDQGWQLTELWQYMGFRYCTLGIGCLMTLANAASFWLFAHFRTTQNLRPHWAICATATVLVVGPALGMNFPILKFISSFDKRIWDIDTTDSDDAEQDPMVRLVIPELFKGFAIYAGLASLCGTVIAVANGPLLTTILFTLALYFGASVLPLAQVSFGYSVPAHLKIRAMAFYQFAYQATWMLGPILPVIMAGIFGGTAYSRGLRMSCLLNWVACICFWQAMGERRSGSQYSSQILILGAREPLLFGEDAFAMRENFYPEFQGPDYRAINLDLSGRRAAEVTSGKSQSVTAAERPPGQIATGDRFAASRAEAEDAVLENESNRDGTYTTPRSAAGIPLRAASAADNSSDDQKKWWEFKNGWPLFIGKQKREDPLVLENKSASIIWSRDIPVEERLGEEMSEPSTHYRTFVPRDLEATIMDGELEAPSLPGLDCSQREETCVGRIDRPTTFRARDRGSSRVSRRASTEHELIPIMSIHHKSVLIRETNKAASG